MGRGRRSSHRFRDHWHYRSVALPDGDTLSYVVMDEPAPPRLECPRSDRYGGLDHAEAIGLLRAAGHPDAELDARTVPSSGLRPPPIRPTAMTPPDEPHLRAGHRLTVGPLDVAGEPILHIGTQPGR